MPVIFVSKEDPFYLVEVERIDPVPDENPETRAPSGEPGRWLDIRYRVYGAESGVLEEWNYTTRGHLMREYRALNGRQAKELMSPSESTPSEEEETPTPEPEPEEKPRRKLFRKKSED